MKKWFYAKYLFFSLSTMCCGYNLSIAIIAGNRWEALLWAFCGCFTMTAIIRADIITTRAEIIEMICGEIDIPPSPSQRELMQENALLRKRCAVLYQAANKAVVLLEKLADRQEEKAI